MTDDDKGKEYGDRRLATLRAKLVDAVGLDLLTKVAREQRLPIGAGLSVVIVGGGFAGLASAYFLSALGFDVTLFEAKDRWGGRVWTNRNDFVPAQNIEFGAELIGWNHAVWRGLADSFGLTFAKLTGDESLSRPWDLGDRVVTGHDADELDAQVDALFGLLATEAQRVLPYRPWEGARDLDAQTLGAWLDRHVSKPEVRTAAEIVFANDNVGPTHEQGLLGVLAQIAGGGCERFEPDTEVMRCAQGNDALATQLVRFNPQAVLKLDTPVYAVGVVAGQAFATLRTSAVAPRVVADFAVVAVPPSMYSTGASPRLDIRNLNPADYSITLGPAVKHFARVTTRFWKGEGKGPDGMSKAIGETWDATDAATTGPYELSLFAGGQAAQTALAARTPTDPHADGFYTPNLKRLYSGYAPQGTHMVPWPEEKWIRCGYSCLAPGQMVQATRLTLPFQDRIVFAGEHTCPAFYGYMEGALESGLLAADRILESMGWYEKNRKPHNAIRLALELAARAGTQPDPNLESI